LPPDTYIAAPTIITGERGKKKKKKRKRRRREKSVGIKIIHTSHFFIRERKRKERGRRTRIRRESWKRSNGMMEENEKEREEVKKI
jgi:hypothetical protein